MAVTAGDRAPSFTAPGTLNGERSTYSLEQFAGTPVVLVFYPGDNTPVCTRQLNAYTDDIDQFIELGAQILAFSPEDLDSHEGFAAHQGGFAFPLLPDSCRCGSPMDPRRYQASGRGPGRVGWATRVARDDVTARGHL